MTDVMKTTGFCELSNNEMTMVDGGGWFEAVGATFGAGLFTYAPAIGAVVGGPAGWAVGIGVALIGAGLVGKNTGLY